MSVILLFCTGLFASTNQLSSIASVERTTNLHAAASWVDQLGTRSWCPRLLVWKSHTSDCASVYRRKRICMLVVVKRLASLSACQYSSIGTYFSSREAPWTHNSVWLWQRVFSASSPHFQLCHCTVRNMVRMSGE